MKNLFKSLAKISGLTLLSRISGLARDVIIARSFGAGPMTDAFWVAFRIPNLLRRLFAEGAFSQAFIPILKEIQKTESADRTQQLIDHTALVLSISLLILTAIGIIGAPWFTLAVASGLTENDNFEIATTMTRIMFPYILCMSLVSFASGILNTWSRFAIPAFTPILLNLSMIACSLLLVHVVNVPIYALSIGVMVGGVLQLGVQWMALAKLGLLPRFSLRFSAAFNDHDVRRLLKNMLPAILGLSVTQISILINTNIATYLEHGSVTWLSFSDRLMEFPSALLGMALGTVLLPSLSEAYSQKDSKTYNALMDWGIKLILLFGLPACIGMALLRTGLVSVLFNYGAFNELDVEKTSSAVLAYSIGLIGILSIKILAPAFYARQDIKTPIKIGVIILCLTQALNLIFVPLLQHTGLTLSIALGSLFNASLLYVYLRKHRFYQPSESIIKFLVKLLPALIVLTLFLYLVQSPSDWLNSLNNHGITYWTQQLLMNVVTDPLKSFQISRIICLFGLIFASILCYFATLFICGFRIRDFKRYSPS
ncbi:murein biosynthesis integral membrane protein MurJ [Basilea psittacipulmonis]|uniref:Probable lipid II flippase MurJ n=1 Tax=Basilea psittacipulmonis DSM 24701 TaxID=1072685 RepID=A0A077DC19_9BURK|nr:murein biosynthesis integral membrane protein MurJ [Basilea psittacipulmonis]AIL32405.1 membrane protein [Basilea psittacipulmonis DSM 24701]